MVENINVSVEDEVWRNEEYISKLDRNVKIKCSIQLVAENLSKIEVFRDAVAKYFAEKKYIIESCRYRTLDYVLYTFLLNKWLNRRPSANQLLPTQIPIQDSRPNSNP